MLKRSWAGLFREHLLKALDVKELSSHFDERIGRPTKDLYVALGVLILQQLHDLTDSQVVEELAFNLAWHYALDIRDESDVYLCERSLRNYRRIVIDQGLDRMLFQNLTDELIKVFRVDSGRQRIDSTAIRSAMRLMTRVETVVETLSKFFRECTRLGKDQLDKIDPTIVSRYIDRQGSGCFSFPAPNQSKRCLEEVGRDILLVWMSIKETTAREFKSFQLLERVLKEQFEVVEREDESDSLIKVKTPKEIPCDNVRNPSDPDSSYNSYHGQGYLAQVMETYSPTETDSAELDLITYVDVHKMTIGDSRAIEPAVRETIERKIKPDLLLGVIARI